MPIPGPVDAALAEIDDLHNSILVRLRVWQRAGPNRDPKSIREALQTYAYADAVIDFVNGARNE
jgi:hypothetical protein